MTSPNSYLEAKVQICKMLVTIFRKETEALLSSTSLYFIPTSWYDATPCVHCVHHRCWVKTRGMRLDARADFSGKKWVFSQTNSHLLSGRVGQKGGTSTIIAAPCRLLGCCRHLFAEPIKRRINFLKR